MSEAQTRKWPRWWELDDWIAVAILVPTLELLNRIRRLRRRTLRLILSAVVIIVALTLWVLTLI